MSERNPIPTDRPLRQVKSFVLRTGRMTPAQRRAYDEAWPHYGLSSSQGLLNLNTVFQRDSDVVLEIGFGMGDSLIQMAQENPEQDFIGIEVHRPGVGRLLNLISENGLSNVRVFAEDAIEALNVSIADNSLAKVQIFFPDPWHKKKHHKRRIIQADFIQLLRRKLKDGGTIHLATDWQNYAEHMLEVMQNAEGFRNHAADGSYSPRPSFRPQTKFERRGERLGHGVWDLLFCKI